MPNSSISSRAEQDDYHFVLKRNMRKDIEFGCMNEKLIRTDTLGNNLKLELYDASRKIAGGRWLVSLVAKIDIPINDSILPIDGEPDTDIIEIRKALGESVCFKLTRNRNFIAATQKEATLQDLIESFLSISSSYLSHKDFPKKFIAKEYKKHLKMKSWYTDPGT